MIPLYHLDSGKLYFPIPLQQNIERRALMQVNSQLESSEPGVYAIGDVAAFPLKEYNIVTRQEHVANARQSAKHAVSHIVDPDGTQPYDYFPPNYYSRVMSLSWQVTPPANLSSPILSTVSRDWKLHGKRPQPSELWLTPDDCFIRI